MRTTGKFAAPYAECYRYICNKWQIFEGLKSKGVLVKNLDKAGGSLKDCLRVTVGMPEENKAFINALKQVLAESTA